MCVKSLKSQKKFVILESLVSLEHIKKELKNLNIGKNTQISDTTTKIIKKNKDFLPPLSCSILLTTRYVSLISPITLNLQR